MYREKARSFIAPSAFKIEYERKFPRVALYKDIESYLGEYRFEVQRYPYQLLLARGIDPYSSVDIRDVDQKESMIEKAERALQKKQAQWKNSHREQADLQGLRTLREQLYTASTGDIVVWTSPPGPKEDGYGDYGFVYIGEIEEVGEAGEKQICMAAIRVENQTVKQCNTLLSSLTGQAYLFATPEDCVAYPTILKNRELTEVERGMRKAFNFSIDSQKDAQFAQSMKILNPHIHTFIDMVHSGAPKDLLITAFHSLENYALELRSREVEDKLHFAQMIEKYGKEKPPVVGGSCGNAAIEEKNPDGSPRTSNIFNKYSTLQKILEDESDKFECPACHKKSDPPVGEQCPECKITIQEALKQGIIQQVCA